MTKDAGGVMGKEPNQGDSSMVAEAVAKKGAEKLVEYAPSLISRAYTRLRGNTILVLGPEHAGKTSFLHFLEHLLLRSLNSTASTVKIKRRKSRTIRLGPERSLILRVGKPLDTPGQLPLFDLTEYIYKYRPNCIVVVLDATSPLEGHRTVSSIVWLNEFCEYLDEALWKSVGVAKRLRKVVVLMNKMDELVSDERKTQKENFEAKVKEVIESHRSKFRRYRRASLFHIMPCILVPNNQGTKLADEVIETIATILSGKRSNEE